MPYGPRTPSLPPLPGGSLPDPSPHESQKEAWHQQVFTNSPSRTPYTTIPRPRLQINTLQIFIFLFAHTTI